MGWWSWWNWRPGLVEQPVGQMRLVSLAEQIGQMGWMWMGLVQTGLVQMGLGGGADELVEMGRMGLVGRLVGLGWRIGG